VLLLILSLLPPSYIVALIRELVNILFFTYFTTLQSNPITQLLFNIDIDVDINIIRERSAFSSQISSRELLTHLAISSIPYHERIEIQNNLQNKDK